MKQIKENKNYVFLSGKDIVDKNPDKNPTKQCIMKFINKQSNKPSLDDKLRRTVFAENYDYEAVQALAYGKQWLDADIKPDAAIQQVAICRY